MYPLLTLFVFNSIGILFELSLSVKTGLPIVVYDSLVFLIWFIRKMFPIIWVWQTLEIALELFMCHVARFNARRLDIRYGESLKNRVKNAFIAGIKRSQRLVALFLGCQLVHAIEVTAKLPTRPFLLVSIYVISVVLIASVQVIRKLLIMRTDGYEYSVKELIVVPLKWLLILFVLQGSSLIVQLQSEAYSYGTLILGFGILLIVGGMVNMSANNIKQFSGVKQRESLSN